MLVASGASVTNVGRHPCRVASVDNVIVPELSLARLRAALGGMRLDGVMHLAAAGVNPTDRDIDAIFRINAALAPGIVRLAVEADARAVIVIGSSSEYRPSIEVRPIREDAPLETMKVYGASKAAGGILALACGAAEALPVGVLRLFHVFGPGEGPHRLLPSLARGLSNGEAVKLSAGTQIRDFVHVDDACRGIIAAWEALAEGRAQAGAYNVASGRGVSVADFARTVARVINADSNLLEFGALPMRQDDAPYVVGDPGSLHRAASWVACTSLESAIQSSLNEFRMGPC